MLSEAKHLGFVLEILRSAQNDNQSHDRPDVPHKGRVAARSPVPAGVIFGFKG